MYNFRFNDFKGILLTRFDSFMTEESESKISGSMKKVEFFKKTLDSITCSNFFFN